MEKSTNHKHFTLYKVGHGSDQTYPSSSVGRVPVSNCGCSIFRHYFGIALRLSTSYSYWTADNFLQTMMIMFTKKQFNEIKILAQNVRYDTHQLYIYVNKYQRIGQI